MTFNINKSNTNNEPDKDVEDSDPDYLVADDTIINLDMLILQMMYVKVEYHFDSRYNRYYHKVRFFMESIDDPREIVFENGAATVLAEYLHKRYGVRINDEVKEELSASIKSQLEAL